MNFVEYIDFASIFIGLSGGIFAIRFRSEADAVTLKVVLYLLFAGVIGSVLIGTTVCEYFELTQNRCYTAQLVCSTGTDYLISAILKLFKMFEENPLSVIKKFLNNGKNN